MSYPRSATCWYQALALVPAAVLAREPVPVLDLEPVQELGPVREPEPAAHS
jgi:hypothetical protein